MQVAIYEHLQMVQMHNIWFHGGTDNCGRSVKILGKLPFMNIYICHGVPYACIIFGFLVVQATVAVHSKHYESCHL